MVRACAARTVFDVVYGGASLDAALDRHTGRLDGNDRALFRELSYGGLRWFWRCKGVIDQLVTRPPRKRDRIVEAVMAIGIYQLDRMRLPAHAAIHATVQSCETLDRTRLKGMVNGVLRNFQRGGDGLLAGLSDAARVAHPDWLWQAIRAQWPDQADAVVNANNNRPPMTLRVNTGATSVPVYLEALRAADIEGRALPHAPAAVVLDRPVDVDRLPGFREGRVSIQDASAQLLPGLIQPVPGFRVLDACAAPGGKLTHLLEAFPGLDARAVELDPERAARITENLERLHLRADVTVADAAALDRWWDGHPFDLVVLDAPCSATGVVRRHPDIKVLRRSTDPERLAATQGRLMDQLWPTVKPGGRMIYVTCSILASENQDGVDDFLGRTADAREERFKLPVGRALRRGWQVLPGEGEGDGFYYAVLCRSPGAGDPAGSAPQPIDK